MAKSAGQHAKSHARYVLTGPERDYDPRVTPIRSDLADISLAGQLFAPHYAEPLKMRCVADRATIWDRTHRTPEPVSELLYGESFHLLDVAGDEGWGYCAADSYVGSITMAALVEASEQAGKERLVGQRQSAIYAEPDIRAPVVMPLSMASKLLCTESSECGRYWQTGDGFVPKGHLVDAGKDDTDLASLAEQFVHTPYVWGGRSARGIDCSGLVQVALAVLNVESPRDSDQQMAALGTELGEKDALQRGDLVFFPDHVGIMADADSIIHANRHWMRVIVEPLADVVARFAEQDEAVLARKRLS